MPLCKAPVAQLDRVSASEAEGRAFESRRVRHFFDSVRYFPPSFKLHIKFILIPKRLVALKLALEINSNKHYPGPNVSILGKFMIDVVAAVIREDDLIFCFKKGNAKYDYLSNKYEFPGGKIEHNEDHRQALTREIHEELHANIAVGEHMLSIEHRYPDFDIRLHFYACTMLSNAIELTEHTELLRLPIAKLRDIQWLPADIPAVDFLVNGSLLDE